MNKAISILLAIIPTFLFGQDIKKIRNIESNKKLTEKYFTKLQFIVIFEINFDDG